MGIQQAGAQAPKNSHIPENNPPENIASKEMIAHIKKVTDDLEAVESQPVPTRKLINEVALLKNGRHVTEGKMVIEKTEEGFKLLLIQEGYFIVFNKANEELTMSWGGQHEFKLKDQHGNGKIEYAKTENGAFNRRPLELIQSLPSSWNEGMPKVAQPILDQAPTSLQTLREAMTRYNKAVGQGLNLLGNLNHSNSKP